MNEVTCHIAGFSVLGRGLPDAAALASVLDGGAPGDELPKPQPGVMSPRERRRAPVTVRWALAAAEAACIDAGLAPGEPEAVFASGMGDLDITDYMCRTLADSPQHLSPTRFHNSVHNAPSGYWSIGAGATGDITALSALYDSVVAALWEAAGRLYARGRPLLLVSYDISGDGAMTDIWPTRDPFAAAVVLAPGAQAGRAGLSLAPGEAHTPAPDLPPPLQALVDDNPAARILPLLALARAPAGAGLTLRAEQGPPLCLTRTT